MAGYATDFYAQKILDHANRVATWTPPSVLFVSLTTVVLTRQDVVMPSGAELNGFGYGRKQIANDSTFWSPAIVDPATGFVSSHNLVDVVFANATSDYPLVPGWAILDASIGGNVLHAGAFTDQVGVVFNGDTPVITTGSLVIPVSGS